MNPPFYSTTSILEHSFPKYVLLRPLYAQEGYGRGGYCWHHGQLGDIEQVSNEMLNKLLAPYTFSYNILWQLCILICMMLYWKSLMTHRVFMRGMEKKSVKRGQWAKKIQKYRLGAYLASKPLTASFSDYEWHRTLNADHRNGLLSSYITIANSVSSF